MVGRILPLFPHGMRFAGRRDLVQVVAVSGNLIDT